MSCVTPRRCSSSITASIGPVIALWLGHESVETTQLYLRADMRLKEQALARTTPTDVKPGRYRPPDQLLAFLERL
jgi:integrase/recombinase XerD